MASPRLRVLAVTRIFPNRVEPLACAFARQQLAALRARCDVEVLAVIPYLPGAPLLGDRTRPGKLRRVPARDVIDGLAVTHPRAPYVPGGGATLAPLNAALYFGGLLPHLPRLRGRFDVVLGAYLFPDACAAAWLARALGLPYVVKAHGTDANVVAEWPSVRPFLRRMLGGASAAIGVSRPMVEKLVALGARPDRAVLVRNGVDRGLFRPEDKASARRALGLPESGNLFVFVGRLEKEKGVRELVRAFEAAALGAETRLAFVGDGTLRAELEEARGRLGERLVLAGGRPLPEVAKFVSASDALVLPSYAEGTPNVILEALAAGRPIVATAVGGIPDVVEEGRTGLLVPPKDEEALARALGGVLASTWNEAALVASAPPSWAESAEALERVLAGACAGVPPPREEREKGARPGHDAAPSSAQEASPEGTRAARAEAPGVA